MALTRQTSAPRRLVTAAALALFVFSVPFAARVAARPVVELPYLTDVTILGAQVCDTCPPQVCSTGPLSVKVAGEIPGCVRYHGLQVQFRRGAPTPLIIADFVVDTCGVPCPAFIRSFTDSITIPNVPQMPLGPQSLWVESHVRSCPDTTQIARAGARPFPIDVIACAGGPPPIDSLLKSFLHFQPVPQPPCAGDTLLLEMRTNGCPPCLHFESLLPDTTGRIRATMSWRPNCLELACRPESLYRYLGPFAAGHYVLAVDVDVHVLDTPVQDSTVSFTVNVPFDVSAPPCTPIPPPCVSPILSVPNPQPCAIELAPSGEGVLTLTTQTPVTLGGLQGRIDCPPPFRVTGVFPPELPGLNVSWTPDGERGARYVVFTAGGATIPAGTSAVLEVTLLADSSAVPGAVADLFPWVTLASDPSGHAVPICELTNVRHSGTPLCIGAAMACDVNHDAASDVRDLVLMTHCLLIDPPGGTDMCPDCNGNGSWAFDDVLCCAQKILQLPIPVRDSVSGDGPQVTIEELSSDATGRTLSVRLSGADGLGAAMLRLRYPGERWRAYDMRVMPLSTTDAAGWFPIVDTQLPGVLRLGGLRLSSSASSEIEFTVRFEPVGDPRDGDELVTDGADLAASDGTAFTLATKPTFDLKAPAPPVGPNVELGPARPNPFNRSTRFSVNLPQPAHVELTMHDLSGRRIATLIEQDLPAGRRDAVWDAGGARDGMYFARLVVNGRVFTQRVALLRDRR